MKNLRKWLILGVFVLILSVCAGCGATVDTEMTVDADFSGSRVITLTIATDDLEYITGGFAALDTVVKDNLPEQLTYASADVTDGKAMTFTLAFTDVEDYRTKVAALIAAGTTQEEKDDNDVLVPEVVYDRNESVFKKGVLFEENFTSVDLLDWLREALRTTGIVTESESYWYETGTNTLKLEEWEDSTSGSFSLNDQDNSCLSSCEVTTEVSIDNQFVRTIVFTADSDTVQELADKDCILKDYFAALAPEGCEYAAVEDEDEYEYYEYTYTFTIRTADAADLVAKTNAILQTEANALTMEAKVHEEKSGVALITYTEALDGSFYLDYDRYGNPVGSTVILYDGAAVVDARVGEDEISYYTEENGFNYQLGANKTYQFTLEWEIGFAGVDMSVESEGKDAVSLELNCHLPQQLSDEMKQSAIDRMKGFFGSEENYKVEGDDFIITFSGAVADVQQQVNAWLVKAAAIDDGDPPQYFAITEHPFETSSFLTTGVAYEVECDFSPVLGDVMLKVEGEESAFGSKYYVGTDALEGQEGDYVASDDGYFSVFETKLSVLGVIIGGVSVLVLLVGIVLLLIALKPFKMYLTESKERKAQAKLAAQTAQPVPVPAGAVAPSVYAPVGGAEEMESFDEPEAPVVPVAPVMPVQPVVPVAPVVPHSADVTDDDEEEIL